MKLYNTLSRKLEPVTPIHENQLGLYTCGPTVYDYLTIGNWTAYLRWDVLARTLRDEDYNLKWVMNITDVGHLTSDADEGEDKLEKGARREGKSAWEIADFYTQDFLRGLKFLHIEMGEQAKIVKATDHIDEQIELVQQLEAKGFTYVATDGVYFDTSKLKGYGKLAKLDIDGLKAGARVDSVAGKKNITDFALWKFSPKDQKRDMEWESPWGTGFPGWHIECSAMSMKYLGETIDIHTGGIDHIPVHHTNEIAQSEAATGKQFANIWVHGNFLQINNGKIAKSAGNGYTLQDIVAKGFSSDDIRMLVLQSHYRSEANFTWDIMQAAQNRLKHWQQAASLRWQPYDQIDIDLDFISPIESLRSAMQNDLLTPEALRVVDEVVDLVLSNGLAKGNLRDFTKFLEAVRSLLGFDLFDDDIDLDAKHVLTQRSVARDSKNWPESDRLRDELEKIHIGINDTPAGQKWYRL